MPEYLFQRTGPHLRANSFHDRIQEGRFPNTRYLVDKFEISERTALRDLDYMRDALHLPLLYDRKRRGFAYSRPVTQFPRMPVSEAELFAVLVASKVMSQYEGTPFAQPLGRTLHKLTGLLDIERELTLSHLQEALTFRPLGQGKAELKVFELLTKAVHQRRQVSFRYRRAGESKAEPRSVCPLHIACIHNRWYLFAFDNQRQAERTFVLDRIRSVRLRTRPIPGHITFDPQVRFRNAFGATLGSEDHEVVVEFDAWGADLIGDRQWTATQVIKRLRNGGIRLSMRLNSLDDVERWLLGFGDSATVVQPPELARRLRARALAVAQKYRS